MKKIIIIPLAFICIINYARATNYYFSSSAGDDSRTASQAQNPATPWKSYSKLNSFFSSLLPGDSALFKRGESFFSPTTLTISRSGTLSQPVIIGAYGVGAKPVITGLVNLTWVNVGSNLWRSNETITGTTLNLVTKDNIPIERGRWPNRDNGNNGYNTIANATTNTISQTTGGELSGMPLVYPGCVVYQRVEKFWGNCEWVKLYNPATHVITFALSSGDRPPQKNFGYFIQNDSATLDQQGEWWFNRGRLKMFSVGTPVNVAAAGVKIFIYAIGRNYITIDNINFNGCDSDAIRLSGGTNIMVQNCTIQNVGRNGIKSGTNNFQVLNTSILWSLSKGIEVTDGAYAPKILYDTIRNTGQLIGHNTGNIEDGHGSHSGVGIYMINPGKFAEIGYCQITNSGHNGIHLREFDSAYVHDNYIDSVDNVDDDGGGIYTYKGNDLRSGSVCRIIGNIILHGIGAPAGGSGNFVMGAGVAGIYHDLSSTDCFDSANFISGFGQGMLLNFGCNHMVVTWNTFYNNSLDGIQINTRLKMGDTTRNLNIQNNVIIAALASQKTLVTYSDDGDVLNKFGVIDYNIYARPLDDNYTMSYQSGAITKANLPGWKSHYSGYDQHSLRSPFTFSSLANQSDSTNFYFNNSASPVVVNVSDTSQDAKGNAYAGPTTLPAGRALFLFTTGSSVPPPPPPDPPAPPGPLTTSNIIYSRYQIKIL